jgi:hypothetical protein
MKQRMYASVSSSDSQKVPPGIQKRIKELQNLVSMYVRLNKMHFVICNKIAFLQ